MKLKDVVLGLALVVVAVVGVNFPVNGETIVEKTVSAVVGPEVFNHMYFYEGLTDGGNSVTVTPTSGAVTLTNAQLVKAKVVTFTASSTMPALTATLPASTTFPLPNKAGAYRTWVIENPFLAAATTTTIAAGTGVDLQEPDGQNVVINITDFAFLTCFRKANSDVVCAVDETIPAD